LKVPTLLFNTLLVAAAYYVSARLGLRLQFEDTQATPVWPPSGIAFSALLLFGWRISGGIFLGAFLANIADFYVKSKTALPFNTTNLLRHLADHPEQIAVSATIGIGNMLEAVAGSYLVRRFNSGSDISENIRSVRFFILAALVCCLVSSTLGVSSLFLASILPYHLLSTAWFTWWLGDATGILIVTPLVLVWSQLSSSHVRAQQWGRMAVAILFLFLFSQFTFNGWLDFFLVETQASGLVPVLLKTQAYMFIPILLWIEFMFGNILGTLGIAMTSAIAVLGTVHGHGPFVGSSQNESLLVLQGFVGVMSMTVLLLDAALRERRQALAELIRARDHLEVRVEERTVELRHVNDELSRQISERNLTLESLQRETAERRRTEEILRQAQKMEAVGQLTGGIAHDFNNLLTVIIGNLDKLQRGLGGIGGPLRNATDAAMRGAMRAASLVERLLAFSRQHPLDPRMVNVNKLVTGMSELIRHTLDGSITCEMVLADEVAPSFCDPNQLESALLNLVINSRDALPEGGTLTIETANIFLDEFDAEGAEVGPGHYVMLAVSDSGIGMSPTIRAKAFEPFFTTKDVGKGTGLGLSMVYGFVKQSHGRVRIDSEPGRGTSVKLYLPQFRAE
jgi:signal transduction histidine kinase